MRMCVQWIDFLCERQKCAFEACFPVSARRDEFLLTYFRVISIKFPFVLFQLPSSITSSVPVV